MQSAFQPPPAPPTGSFAARFRPSVTVAAVIWRAAASGSTEYLLVQEETAEGLRLNNPAGHLEQGESPEEAVVREVLEETACHFKPEAFLGVFLARFQRAARRDPPGVTPTQALSEDITYVRLAYAGRASEPVLGQALDVGIITTCWLSAQALWGRQAEWRSPLVGRSIQAHQCGQHLPLGTVWADPTIWQPEQR